VCQNVPPVAGWRRSRKVCRSSVEKAQSLLLVLVATNGLLLRYQPRPTVSHKRRLEDLKTRRLGLPWSHPHKLAPTTPYAYTSNCHSRRCRPPRAVYHQSPADSQWRAGLHERWRKCGCEPSRGSLRLCTGASPQGRVCARVWRVPDWIWGNVRAGTRSTPHARTFPCMPAARGEGYVVGLCSVESLRGLGGVYLNTDKVALQEL
jgi:hypothetical protein